MKHLTIILLVMSLLVCPAVMADERSDRGMAGLAAPEGGMTAALVQNESDGTEVTLRGRIEEDLGGGRYRFDDASGSAALSIDYDFGFEDMNLGPNDILIIKGTVQRDFDDISVKVDSVSKE